ncbi:hypothetical protein [Variovorax sp. MHTC-1]|nr:hypothetical protein [Variovorax sp. MHTC-1]
MIGEKAGGRRQREPGHPAGQACQIALVVELDQQFLGPDLLWR